MFFFISRNDLFFVGNRQQSNARAGQNFFSTTMSNFRTGKVVDRGSLYAPIFYISLFVLAFALVCYRCAETPAHLVIKMVYLPLFKVANTPFQL